MYFARLPSPLGELLLARDSAGLRRLDFPTGKHRIAPASDWEERPEMFAEEAGQLDAYFRGELRAFNLELAPQGTAFQQKVFTALRAIPYGKTVSYGEIAQEIGQPTASRAVGAANGRNPLPIFIPCHRVIGSKGALTGFAAGIDTKIFLLRIEQKAHPTEENSRLDLGL